MFNTEVLHEGVDMLDGHVSVVIATLADIFPGKREPKYMVHYNHILTGDGRHLVVGFAGIVHI